MWVEDWLASFRALSILKCSKGHNSSRQKRSLEEVFRKSKGERRMNVVCPMRFLGAYDTAQCPEDFQSQSDFLKNGKEKEKTLKKNVFTGFLTHLFCQSGPNSPKADLSFFPFGFWPMTWFPKAWR